MSLKTIIKENYKPSVTSSDFCEEAKIFQKVFDQAKFEEFDNTEGFVWLLSTLWIEEWKNKVAFEVLDNNFEYTEMNIKMDRVLPLTNSDLIDKEFADVTDEYEFLKVDDDHYKIFNTVTKGGIYENQDFIVLSADHWEFITLFYPQAIEIKKIKYLDPITDKCKIEINFPMLSTYFVPQADFKNVHDPAFKPRKYKCQVSKRMEVQELKSLFLKHIEKVFREDTLKLPSTVTEKHLGLYLFKGDFSFTDFLECLGKAYKSQFSHVEKIPIRAECLNYDTKYLFKYDITLNTSVIFVEIKAFFNFKLKGENEDSDDDDDDKFFSTSKSKPVQLKFPEHSQYSMNGLTGLKNIGNTCFMNSALQCLSHTKDLKDYFLSKEYENDINTDNPMGSKDSGLMKSIASLLFELWNGINSVVVPTHFKNEIGKFRAMFEDFNQHDSQELLNETLDGLHEDLNLIKKKPYVEIKDIGKLEADKYFEIGRMAWIQFLRRNYSHIIKLFFAQYKSEVECLICQKVSITFDPYHIITLPIPKMIIESITFFHITPNHNTKAIKYSVELKYEKGRDSNKTLPTASTIVEEFAKYLKIDHENLILSFLGFSVFGELINGTRLSSDVLTKLNDHDYKPKLFLLELNQLEKYKLKDPTCQVFFGRAVDRSSFPCFNKVTFMLQKESTQDLYFEFYKKFAHYYRDLYEDHSEISNVVTTVDYSKEFEKHFTGVKESKRSFKLMFDDKAVPMSPDILIQDYFSKELSKKPKQIDLIIELSDDASDKIFLGNMKECSIHPTDIDVNRMSAENSKIDIRFLIEKFSEREEMSDENNLFYCNQCKKHNPCFKKLEIFTVPRYLVLHMKKLKDVGQSRYSSTKEKPYIDIDFPLENFDMTDYVISKRPVGEYNVQTKEFVEPDNETLLKRMDMDYNFPKDKRLIYDCYGVINHYGSSYFGHYTADIKTDEDTWHKFDDDRVRKIDSPSDVVTDAAYVLFYKLREAQHENTENK